MTEIILPRGRMRDIATAFAAVSIMAFAVPARAEPEMQIAFYDDVRIEVLAEGRGPLIVMLPSRGRGAATRSK